MLNFLAWLAAGFYTVSAIYFFLMFFFKKEKTTRPAFLFLLLGLATHGLDIISFGLDHHRFPASNFPEALTFLTSLVVLLFVLFVRPKDMAPGAIFIVPFTILSCVLAGLFRSDMNLDPVLRGGWANAAPHLMAFLVYDVVLIPPFLMRLPSLAPEHRLSMYLYLFALIYSAGLAIYTLFISPKKRVVGISAPA